MIMNWVTVVDPVLCYQYHTLSACMLPKFLLSLQRMLC